MPSRRGSFFPCTIAVMAAAFIGGCALVDPSDTLRQLAAQAGWTEHLSEHETFTTYALQSPGAATAETLHVYIEGDGRAFTRGRSWSVRRGPPSNPTPRDPLALRLALADPAPGVLYLARPCQYVEGPARKNCTTEYWSTARFAPEVIADINSTISALVADGPAAADSGARRLLLFGFSGGGAVAALIAAHRSDVAALVTVAAPLNHTTWTNHHGVLPLSHSLNPADLPPNAFPETHLAGGKDEIVPPTLVRAYGARRPNANVIVKPTFGHDCCWVDAWPDILTELDLLQ